MRAGWFEAMLADTKIVERFPGYAGVLSRMVPFATTSILAMAVARRRWDDTSGKLRLLVNLDFFQRHPELAGPILLHEIQHVLLGHLTDRKFHVVRYPVVMEVAMEISADEPIDDLIPDHGFSIERFAPFGIRRGQSTLERYRLLVEAVECGALRIDKIGRFLDDHRCAAAGAGIGDLLDEASDGATERNWNRPTGGLGPRSSRATIERMRLAIAAHLKGERGGIDDPRHRGPFRPKELHRTIAHDTSASSLDWRSVLREAFPRRRLVRHDYLRPNRRFPHRVGEIPGRVRRPPRPALLVAIDTSGSMTGDVLDRVAREVRRLRDHARLTIAECDAAVHRVYPLGEPLSALVGGGDTDFAPVFAELGNSASYEGVIYFTDGRGAMPESAPALPVLWAITHEQPFLADYGKIVRIP